MAEKLRIFISSVQKELELERAAVAALISTDPFLLQHCTPVLFEKEPPTARPVKRGYLAALRGCSLYVIVLANEYGRPDRGISATHREYRLAQRLKLPTVVFLKGDRDDKRSPEVKELIAETKRDGYKYVRFHDREDLKPLMLEALRRGLAEEFRVVATPAEIMEGKDLIEAASMFETKVLTEPMGDMLDPVLVRDFTSVLAASDPAADFITYVDALVSRGLMVVRDPQRGTHAPTAGALLLFGRKPADCYPQAEILADAYDDTRVSGLPKGQESINAPLPRALEQVLGFIDAHTFHPRRVVGFNNLRLDEYPAAALREALVNAVAHRSYDDRSRKISVRVYSNRVEIASPGYLPEPLTLARLRKGGYRPCSRNPLIAQTLATLGKMEQRGSGFARMRDAMLNHGLAAPEIAEQEGYFVVTLHGPDGDYGRLRVPADATGLVTPAIEGQLNARQKTIMLEIQQTGAITSGWCRKHFGVALLTVQRDLAGLVRLRLLEPAGKGRGARYTLKNDRP